MHHESWVLEDSIIKDGSYNIDQGVGVRAVSGEKTGLVCTLPLPVSRTMVRAAWALCSSASLLIWSA
jgi:predicted Zn-dependent protease